MIIEPTTLEIIKVMAIIGISMIVIVSMIFVPMAYFDKKATKKRDQKDFDNCIDTLLKINEFGAPKSVIWNEIHRLWEGNCLDIVISESGKEQIKTIEKTIDEELRA